MNTGVPSGVYELGSMITSPGCSSPNAFSASATAPLSSTVAVVRVHPTISGVL